MNNYLCRDQFRIEWFWGRRPVFRTLCKLAVIDGSRKILATDVIYPIEPQNKVEKAKISVLKLIREYNIDIIALGNDATSGEYEQKSS